MRKTKFAAACACMLTISTVTGLCGAAGAPVFAAETEPDSTEADSAGEAAGMFPDSFARLYIREYRNTSRSRVFPPVIR